MKTTPHAVYLKAAKGEWINHSDIAKLIRSALDNAFHGTTFSVRTKTYSGGGSVSVQWTDGPTAKQVEKMADQFSTRSFDGMIDMAHDSSLWLYPDGSAHTAHDSGTEGSMGTHSEIIESPRRADAVLVEHIAGAYIFCTRSVGPKAIWAAIDSLRAEKWDALRAVDWALVGVEETSFGAHVRGADHIQCGGRHMWLNQEIQNRACQIAYPETLPDKETAPVAAPYAPCLCW